MRQFKLPLRSPWPPLILAIVLAATVAPPTKADPPDTYKAVRAALPDSVALDSQVVYVDFWASWCVPCRGSFPWMQELHEKYGDQGLKIVAVNLDKDKEAADKFLKDNPGSFTLLFDPSGDLASLYELEAMPTSFLYGRDGKLVKQHRGFRPEDKADLEQAITKLLEQEGSK